MGFVSDNATLIVVIWSLFMLLIGYVVGYGRGKAQVPPGLDRGRLDRAPTQIAPVMRPSHPATGQSGLSQAALEGVDDAIRAGNKIQAIKLMREQTGMGLAEAKTAVEDRMAGRF